MSSAKERCPLLWWRLWWGGRCWGHSLEPSSVLYRYKALLITGFIDVLIQISGGANFCLKGDYIYIYNGKRFYCFISFFPKLIYSKPLNITNLQLDLYIYINIYLGNLLDVTYLLKKNLKSLASLNFIYTKWKEFLAEVIFCNSRP